MLTRFLTILLAHALLPLVLLVILYWITSDAAAALYGRIKIRLTT